MWSPHNLRLSTRHHHPTVYDSNNQQLQRKHYMFQVSQSLFSILQQEQPLSTDRHFQPIISRKNVWQKEKEKVNFKPIPPMKTKLLNLQEYQSLKTRYGVGRRLGEEGKTDRTNKMWREKRLGKIKTDIEKLHRQMSSGVMGVTSPVSVVTEKTIEASLPKLKINTPTISKTISANRRIKPYCNNRPYFHSKLKSPTVHPKLQISPWQITVD